mgnify:CR=1 FL=1
MTKKRLWTLPILLHICIILFAGYAYNQIITKTTFGEAEIKNRVSSLYNGEVQSMTKKNDQYKVIFTKNDDVYQVIVDEINGTFADLKVVKKGTKQEEQSETNEEVPAEEKPAEPAEIKRLTENQVKDIAQSKFNGEIDEIEFVSTDDGGYYNVDMENDEDEATLQIHALTGEIITITYDD